MDYELTYENVLANWERSKPDFMLWLKEICGVDELMYDQVDGLIQTDEDVAKWIEFFDGDFDGIEKTTLLYKEHTSRAA